MTRRLLAVGCLLALAVATVAGLAVAHGNHATAHPQTSANGTVVVEQAFLTEPGYLVVRADDNGTPGRVLGHRALERGLHTGATVRIDQSEWDAIDGNATVWTVLHADDGDGEFDPDDDDLLLWFDQPAGERVALGKRSGTAHVVTGSGVTETDGELLVERVALPDRGHVVVHERENGSLGRPRGSQALDAGTHTGVRVPVDLSGNRSSWPALSVAVHTDDGDGEFDDDDPVVRVAGEPVAIPVGAVGPTSGPSTVEVNTPAGGNADGTGPTTDAGTNGTGETPADTVTEPTPTTSSDGSGFGVVAVVVAVVALSLAAARCT
ncbi:DUF7282 domain-containing protein [Halorientalis salina]|uniref:DUF7282 domain-containing protein n=1 Tax=Halorientalis salina TaxID=2932266 RepID=UPI0010AC90F1|nr:hypothetical protein [Halorientalis salina]